MTNQTQSPPQATTEDLDKLQASSLQAIEANRKAQATSKGVTVVIDAESVGFLNQHGYAGRYKEGVKQLIALGHVVAMKAKLAEHNGQAQETAPIAMATASRKQS